MDKETRIMLLACAGSIGIALGVTRGWNNLWNNRQLITPSSQTFSFATGLSGHTEYTIFNDGSQDVKIYPGIGHRLWDSELDQDLDGDGRVDRIRKNGPEWKMHRLTELLVRSQDYSSNRERFDEADKILQELMRKYKTH